MKIKHVGYLVSLCICSYISFSSYMSYKEESDAIDQMLASKQKEYNSSAVVLEKVKNELTIRNAQTKNYQITEEEAKGRLGRDLSPLVRIGLGYEIEEVKRDAKYFNIIYIKFAIYPRSKLDLAMYEDIYPITFKRMKIVNHYKYNNSRIEALAVYYAI